MAYTAEQMAAHAELHYDSANRLLNQADTWGDYDSVTQRVMAEAQAGLLAMRLAEYAIQSRPYG